MPINVKNKSSELEKKASELGVSYLEKSPKSIENKIIDIIPQEIAEKDQIAVFEKNQGIIKVAMVDPQNIEALNVLSFVAEKEKSGVKKYLVSEKVFDEILDFYSSPGEMVEKVVESFSEWKLKDEEMDREKIGKKQKQEVLKDAPVAKLVQVIIGHAVEGKASDIHIEPMDDEYRVRFRMDGVLHVSLVIPKEIGPVVVSRIKIMANLKIDEKRKPQDGRFRIVHDGNEIDFRVSSLPVIEGEKIVMRILDKEGGVGDIKSLGLAGTAAENMQAAIQETYGMVLMTGPTGSGKSTTLYALLKILNNEERNIITLEDPIEYDIEGLNQSQVKPEIGYTFANGLRTILRQDPNVIMVGEIRDSETAELAVHAALTGHLMFSTLHTNTAIGAIPRLIDMGIEPFLLSSALRLVAAQRLVRKICESCKEEITISEKIKKYILGDISKISPEEIKKYGLDLSGGPHFYHGKGCDECNGTGLKGRVAIYEVVPLNEDMKTIITEKNGSEPLIKNERDRLGILTMKQDGILKVLLGKTTIEELERITEGNIDLEDD
ncbi:MAG: hypothetical protein COU40_00155 [Candidatus Moranbacteria bacterium CG10_big_fil_rev_8_21_14_0_10_35_21]|nr:MAG: hypothetical protein COU40_00155 [Candidatus Moranbacteria bacterium CG10_big_fil_rev_8_21_14_0_10_35_21]